jgi:hypothetical protein
MTTADVAVSAAILARLLALEAQRAADLVREAREAERAAICSIAARQQADALAFARRTTF